MKILNLDFNKLKSGLSKTRDKLYNKISESFTGKAKLDEEIIEELEETLISTDIGFDLTNKIIEQVKVKLKDEKNRSDEKIIELMKLTILNLINHSNQNSDFLVDIEKYKPFVILVVGVNGSGKTTSIGKLAYNFKNSGLNVIIGAADTFRAAANEQLEIWAKKAGVEIIQKKSGSDPSSVAYETINSAIKNNYDVVIIDTAGRLHNKTNLMEELNKINRVIKKQIPYAPNETFLVVDGTTGQNAMIQSEEFKKYTDITGLIITKLDGTAKGGTVLNICYNQKIPIRFIGIGEKIQDLLTFNSKDFVEAMLNI
ncbi:MAG: signal recognition particle-docking protein FtsY [Ignavibacterium sp.]